MTVREHIAKVIYQRIKIDKINNQVGVAQALGVSEAAISNMIKTGKVDLENIIKLCDALQVTPNELLGYDENNVDRELLDILNSDPDLKAFILTRKK